jgi:hypothetical protein
VLAHQGGWDEMLLSAVLVLGMLGYSRLRRRREGSPRPSSGPSDVCTYCDMKLREGEPRCPSCGFRTDRPER